jgi:hypothetical protein
MQTLDDDSHRRRRTTGVVLNERGEPVLHWPDVLPDGWSVSRRITAMDAAGVLDSAAGAAGGAAMNLEDVFLALPRGLQRRRIQVEVDISNAADAFQRGQALRLAETLIRECQNIADMADQGHIPWDAGVADQGVLAQAARSAADYLRGYMNVAMRSMAGARPVTAPNGLAAAGDRAVSDQDRAFDAHQAMKRSYGDALRGAVSAPAASSAAWGGSGSFGGAAVSDQDRAYSAHEEMKRSISDGWRSR